MKTTTGLTTLGNSVHHFAIMEFFLAMFYSKEYTIMLGHRRTNNIKQIHPYKKETNKKP